MLFIQYMYSLKRSNRPDLAKFMFCMCHSVLTHAEHGHSCARLGHDEHRAFEGAGQLDVQPVPVYIQRQEQYI